MPRNCSELFVTSEKQAGTEQKEERKGDLKAERRFVGSCGHFTGLEMRLARRR